MSNKKQPIPDVNTVDNSEGRFYWLQLNKDFFDDYKIRILMSSKDGEKYVIFYLKLLLESINREGELRFSPEQPYRPAQLSAVLDVDRYIVINGLKKLVELELLEIKADKTIYLPGVKEMTGSITKRGMEKREERARQKNEE